MSLNHYGRKSTGKLIQYKNKSKEKQENCRNNDRRKAKAKMQNVKQQSKSHNVAFES